MCHSTEPGRHLTGPSLAHVYGKKAASAEGFSRYSDALQRSGVVWNDASLNKWLTNPQGFIPGKHTSQPRQSYFFATKARCALSSTGCSSAMPACSSAAIVC